MGVPFLGNHKYEFLTKMVGLGNGYTQNQATFWIAGFSFVMTHCIRVEEKIGLELALQPLPSALPFSIS